MPSKLTVLHEENRAATTRLYRQATADIPKLPRALGELYEQVRDRLVWGNEMCASRELVVDAWRYVRGLATKQELEDRWGVKLP